MFFRSLQLPLYSLLLCSALFLDTTLSFSQPAKTFRSIEFQDTIPYSLHKAMELRLDQEISTITQKGQAKSYIKSLYEQRFAFVVKTFNEDYIMPDNDITSRIRNVLNNIYEANPQLPREVTGYVYRSSSVNALSFGEGTVCVMLGLLERIPTEDILAFILCHELAHHHLRHGDKNIARQAELNYDKVLKKQISAILSSPYGQYTRMKTLFSSLNISVSRHSRVRELEADSVGLTYFLKTRYNPYAALGCMRVLSKADSSLYQENLDFKKFFNFKEFPFKDSWVNYKKSDVWHSTPENVDSLKTHPDCENRFLILKRQLGKNVVSEEEIWNGKPINDLNFAAAFDIVNSHYHFKEYGKALFRSMILANQFPDHPYPHAMIVKSLYQIFKAQQNHQLAKAVELPDPRFEEHYNRFLDFVHKLRLHEIAGLSYHYAVSQPASFFEDEEFLHAVWLCSRVQASKLDPEKVRLDYESLYPRGKYSKEMKNPNTVNK